MKPLDKETLFKLVKGLMNKGFYVISTHAEDRMKERGFTREEIEHILFNPCDLVGEPRYDEEYKTYKYRIKNEENRSVVVSIDFDNLVIVVTVI
ncbi:DUF4258 domain-containing protein [Paenibacillus sp. NAIST15-1]|uniref:DUF4258 domain-containing protein n=1 Tax=Paenibacillus sp. NAIST15-1 TaxID=1605994 RepID=UPI00086A1337|nr:DUF4258 domain-containing protein [Paenibacillus sp. NAIST15-1]GAV11308.1 hypothetical protein PBN151_1235 [Paenibacillus sp. NAIST15-1]